MSNNFLSNPFPVIFATLFYIFCPVLRVISFPWAILVSYLTYSWIEQPGIHKGKRLIQFHEKVKSK